MDTIMDAGFLVATATMIGLGALGVMHWLETRLPVRKYARLARQRELRLGRNKRGK